MIKLTELLKESAASEEAHKRGLVATAYGRWKNQQGQTVAITKNDKLIPIGKDEKIAQGDIKAPPKPTTTSAKAAGTATDSAVRSQDVDKSNGEGESEDAENLSGTEVPEEQPPVVKNVYRSNMEGFGQPITSEKISELNLKDPNGFTKELIIGEESYIATPEELKQFFEAESETEFGLRKIKTFEDAARQRKEWRDIKPPKEKAYLAAIQSNWQQVEPSRQPPALKKKINEFINMSCKGPPPAVCNTTLPIERGMRIKPIDVTEFIKEFRIGEEIDMPPSGFSTSGKVARDYATTYDNIDPDKLGVVIRLSPTPTGQINGLHLSGYKGEDIVDSDPELADEIRAEQFFYQGELEIIRPSGPKARCASVKKIIVPGKQVLYVIDLEELGYQEEKPMREAIQFTHPENEVYLSYMNSPVKQTNQFDNHSLTELYTAMDRRH